MGWSVGEINLVFYTDNGIIAGRYHEWVQDALTVTVSMFLPVGMETDLEKPRRWCALPVSSRVSG